jgi:hypothetical protein
MRRHDRPYGCTMQHCGKAFGSKYDWRRHECFQHNDPPIYRCNTIVPSRTGLEFCAHTSPDAGEFARHLQSHLGHGFNEEEIVDRTKKCYIGWEADRLSFWCGFCREVIVVQCQNFKVRNERFDHIAHHFIAEGKRLDHWTPVGRRIPAV